MLIDSLYPHPHPHPQVYAILELPPRSRPRGTHESGQMVVDKARHWRGLVLAVSASVP